MKIIIILSFIISFSFFYNSLDIKNNKIEMFLKNIISVSCSLSFLYLYPNMSFYLIPLIYNLYNCDDKYFIYGILIIEFLFLTLLNNYFNLNLTYSLVQLSLILAIYIFTNIFKTHHISIKIIIYSLIISFDSKFNFISRHFIANLLFFLIFLFLNNHINKKLNLPKDSLTNLQRYGYLKFIDKKLISDNKPFSILFIDIDDFKYINDTFGHKTGNDIIKKLAKILKNCIRPTDFIVRYGGDEFVIILYNIEKNKAIEVANRIKKEVKSYSFTYNNKKTISITISIGIASSKENYKTFSELISIADKNLYKAKSLGKNCVYPPIS